MTQTARSNLAELRREHERRKRYLELKAARSGNDTPPEVATEIEDIDLKIAEIDQALGAVAAAPASSDVADALGPAGRYQVLYSHIMRLDGDFGQIRREVAALRMVALWGAVAIVATLTVGFVILGALIRL